MTQAPDTPLFAALKPGPDLGNSDWVTVIQAMIDQFGAATLDPDPMHDDPAWARSHGRVGQTMAFGSLTGSLLTHLIHSTLQPGLSRDQASEGYYMDYGFDSLRMVAPVPVDAGFRGRFRVVDTRRDATECVIVKFGCGEWGRIEGSRQIALVANWLTIWLPPGTA